MNGNGSAIQARARGVLLAATSKAIGELQPALERVNPLACEELWREGFDALIVLQRLEHHLSGGGK